MTPTAAKPTLAEVTARAEAEASASLSASDVLAAIIEARVGRSQYVALAESLGVPFITSDARIARSGVARCEVEAPGVCP